MALRGPDGKAWRAGKQRSVVQRSEVQWPLPPVDRDANAPFPEHSESQAMV